MSKIEPLDSSNYRRWSQKLLILFEALEVDYVLFEDPPADVNASESSTPDSFVLLRVTAHRFSKWVLGWSEISDYIFVLCYHLYTTVSVIILIFIFISFYVMVHVLRNACSVVTRSHVFFFFFLLLCLYTFSLFFFELLLLYFSFLLFLFFSLFFFFK